MQKLWTIIFVIFTLLYPTLAFADITQTIDVSAAVSPHASDFQLSISSNPPSSTTVNQNQSIVYTITYGSHLAYATPLTIVGSWDQGTIQGQGSPSVDIVDYVVGSAGTAYNNASPVIDTVNKTITWTIASLPANTIDQTVSFTLQTNSSYTGAQTVTFPTTAHISVSNVTIPDQSITMTYQFNPAITPSPTPSTGSEPSATTTPTNTPSSSTAITPTISLFSPTPSVASAPSPSLAITNVSIETLSSTDATIHITTNHSATVSVQYGTSQQFLNNTQSGILGIDQLIHLKDLQANTTYYFRITAKENTQTITSELFIFKTAVISPLPQIESTSVIVTSEKTLLYDPIENVHGQLHSTAVIPINTAYEFTFALRNKQQVKHIQAFIRNAHQLPTDNVVLFETQPGVYQGRLTTSSIAGLYGLYARVFDTDGNIAEEQIVAVKAIKPLLILDTATKNPIEHAQITMFRLDEQTHAFIKVTQQMLAMKNPDFSNQHGEISFVLPQGTYQAVISAIGYREQTVSFRIGSENGEEYPVVYLKKSLFSFGTIFDFFSTTSGDIANTTTAYVGDIGNSRRFFLFFSTIASIVFLILSFFALSLRIHIPFYFLPWYVWYRLRQLILRRTIQGVCCKVIDEDTRVHVAHAIIRIIDADKNAVLTKLETNPVGECSFFLTDVEQYKISVAKHGYEEHPFFEFTNEGLLSGAVTLPIKKEFNRLTFSVKVWQGCKYVLSLYFELLLMITFFLEMIFGAFLGWHVVLPFLTISFVNVSIWLLHMYSNKNR